MARSQQRQSRGAAQQRNQQDRWLTQAQGALHLRSLPASPLHLTVGMRASPSQVPGALLAALDRGLPIAGILALNSHYSRLASVTSGTLRQYLSSLRSYMAFVDVMSVILGTTVPYFPPDVSILGTWVSTFRNSSTAANYVSALRKWCRTLGWEIGDLDHPELSLGLRGHANLHPGGLRRMKPIRLVTLRALIRAPARLPEPRRSIGETGTPQSSPLAVIYSAFIIAYWFLLRVPSELLPCRSGQLSVGRQNETILWLPRRKNSRIPVTMVRYCVCVRLDPELCPHVHARRLLENAAESPSQLLIGTSSARLRGILREMLRLIGVSDAEAYGLHSFRRGHASDLAEQDISPATLLQMGGWRSAAFQVYIDLPEVEARAATMLTVDESSDEEE
ncbi:hypothetical protein FOZ63_006079 [Perkinsus olseni]|uniref:Tyr recombinase domain-containing protein n=3 Tax=Perkinsus olseni TaxID=32597 RepID=A0A7J6N7L4_PEROL|nr:hypothetical protein FOZ60_014389 [Perkinsus olseni]KAF4759284.1 hypothetical protein FOZ63_006079 [Perkinsus olseni]